MPRYFFHIYDGVRYPDRDGIELPDLNAAKAEAVRASGAMLSDLRGEFWNSGTFWKMVVTDDAGHRLFSLTFSANEDQKVEIAEG